MPKFKRYSEQRYVWIIALLVICGVVAWTQWLQPIVRLRMMGDVPDFKLRGGPDELTQHPLMVDEVKEKKPQLLFAGDSITFGWSHKMGQTYYGLSLWRNNFEPLGAVNVGYPGDDVRSLQWRLEHGLLQSQPKLVVVLMGINDLSEGKPPRKVATSIVELIQTIKKLSPQSQILLHGVFPGGFKPDNAYRTLAADTNRLLAKMVAEEKQVRYIDIGHLFIQPDGMISPEIMYDGLHLTGKGYQIWLDAVLPTITGIMGVKPY